MADSQTITKTFEEVGAFDSEARALVDKRELSPNGTPGKISYPQYQPNTKFGYALGRVLKRSQAVLKNYGDQIEEINIKHCATDDKGIMLLEDDRAAMMFQEKYKFQPKGKIERNKERLQLFRSKTEIEPFYANSKDVPTMSWEHSDIFLDFVIKERPPEPPEEKEKEEPPAQAS